MALVYPLPEDASDPERLVDWLTRSGEDTNEGSIQRIAAIIGKVQHGSRYVASVVRNEMPTFHEPSIAILVSEEDDNKPMVNGIYYKEGNFIGITLNTLEGWAGLDFSTMYDEHYKPGILSNRGMPGDLACIFGVEECHHSFFIQRNGPTQPSNNLNLPMNQYDAIPAEYAALQFKVEHANALSIPVATQEVLRQRLESATKYRQSLL